MSFPLRERGLKPHILVCDSHRELVVPLAGTWIETEVIKTEEVSEESFPLRERGLKLFLLRNIYKAQTSFPLRERGLKLRWRSKNEAWLSSFPLRERGLKLN